MDLDHDGMLDDRDKSGWRHHQALPHEPRRLPNLIDKPMASMYGSD